MNIAALLAGLFSGIAGSMGLGGGAVLIIYLTLLNDMDRIRAGGINLIFFIPISLVAVTIYAIRKQVRWKLVLSLAFFGLLGAISGIWLSGIIGSKVIGRIFGVLLLFFGIKEFFDFR